MRTRFTTSRKQGLMDQEKSGADMLAIFFADKNLNGLFNGVECI